MKSQKEKRALRLIPRAAQICMRLKSGESFPSATIVFLFPDESAHSNNNENDDSFDGWFIYEQKEKPPGKYALKAPS